MGSDSPAPGFFLFSPLFYTFCFFKNVYFLRVTTYTVYYANHVTASQCQGTKILETHSGIIKTQVGRSIV